MNPHQISIAACLHPLPPVEGRRAKRGWVRAGTSPVGSLPALTLAAFLDASPYRARAAGAIPLPEGEGERASEFNLYALRS